MNPTTLPARRTTLRRAEIAFAEAASLLARGDALGALGRIGLAEGARGALLRGVAYAQLGDLDLARASLADARGLAPEGPEGDVLRARTAAALAEIAVVAGDAKAARAAASEGAAILERLGDGRNAAMQRLVVARAEVLLGRPGAADMTVASVLDVDVAVDVRAVAYLTRAEIATRRLEADKAKRAIAAARDVLAGGPNALLDRALAALERDLAAPVARLVAEGVERRIDLATIERLPESSIVIDACRRQVVAGRASIPFAKKPVLFALVVGLARAWPRDVARDALAREAFGVQRVNASHRARLRVEVGRVRKLLAPILAPVATADGYALSSSLPVVIVLPMADDDDAKVAVLLGDGATWTARSVADHAGISLRTAQRALGRLVDAGRVRRSGTASKAVYASASPAVASRLLLLGLLPHDPE